MADGSACRAAPIKGRALCFWHAPDKGKQAQEARRLGGLRRRRERALAGAYDFTGLGSVESIRRLLEIVVLDGLGLENSINRGRLLVGAATAAARLLEAADLEARVASLEAAIAAALPPEPR